MSPAESRHTRERVCPRVVQIAGVEEKCLAVATVRRYRPAHSGEGPNHDLVDVTPSPIFARFKRSHDGVLCLLEVLGGVPILRGITAADVAADFAKAQMNPRIAHLQALLTPIGLRGWVLYLIQVRASFLHRLPLVVCRWLCFSAELKAKKPGNECRPGAKRRGSHHDDS